MQPFVAIDFETANGKRASACSVGLAKFNAEGQVTDSFHSLIQPHPEHRFFHPANTWIHGIRHADVEDAPEWGDLFDQVEAFVGDLPLTAHNFAFDGSVLNQLTDLYQLPHLVNPRYCTLHLSRQIYPDLPSASLDTVFGHLFPGEELDHHHAEADAIAAGQIFVEMQRSTSPSELDALLGPARQAYSVRGVPQSDAVTGAQLVERFGSSTALQGETVCFTGTLTRGKRSDMEELITHLGATPAKNVTKKTTLLVVGVPNPGTWREGSSASRKLEQASALREKGMPIRVLSEEDFFTLLEQ